MGAALTYARRYGLFTLVGIAGEDDLDAPDLGGTSEAGAEQQAPSGHESNGHAGTAPAFKARRRGPPAASAVPILGPDQSALQRDQLLAELEHLQTSDEAAVWAQQNLPTKNTLTEPDAKLVETNFQVGLAAFDDAEFDKQPSPAQLGPGERQIALTSDAFQPTDAFCRRSPSCPPRGDQDHPIARQGSSPIRIPTALLGMR